VTDFDIGVASRYSIPLLVFLMLDGATVCCWVGAGVTGDTGVVAGGGVTTGICGAGFIGAAHDNVVSVNMASNTMYNVFFMNALLLFN
jgi:hypothetical protein